MRREIGGEFEFDFNRLLSNDERCLNQIFGKYKHSLVHSGRAGIKQILTNLIDHYGEEGEYLLPSYLCESIVQPFRELNLTVNYYNINQNLTIDIEDLLSKVTKKTKAIYFINYFGIQQPNQIISDLLGIKNKGIFIIEDTTHNFFSKREDIGDFVVASLRKWGPLPHGGVVMVKNDTLPYKNLSVESERALRIGQWRSLSQQLKYFYLNGLNNGDLKEKYLQIFDKSNIELDSYIDITPMDQLSVHILKTLDTTELSAKRRSNYKTLYKYVRIMDNINIVNGDIPNEITPLGFHIALDERDRLRKFLITNNVYASVHWELPREIQLNFKDSYILSKRILTIPCDQRYDEKDMEFIADLLKKYHSSR